MEHLIYDLIGIGIGPFNLSMAAMLHDLPELKGIFIDRRPGFNWHPGLLLPAARMQVPYYADLITIVNPRSPFTFHNYLQKNGHFFRYANQNTLYPLRIEYNRYCQWVAGQLPSLRFSERCENITFDKKTKRYAVHTGKRILYGKHLVLGTGTTPYLPAPLAALDNSTVLHAADYLFRKAELLTAKRISLLGSGQSAAEIFHDLLPQADSFEQLTWLTRSNRFHPMDFSSFATEMTSIDYIDYFYQLEDGVKASVLKEQQYLYKGININLIAQINEDLYIHRMNGGKDVVKIYTGSEVTAANQEGGLVQLTCRRRETGRCFTHETQKVIAATGYGYTPPSFLKGIASLIDWKEDGRYQMKRNYSIDRNNSVFALNADLPSHGFNSADLGLGPYRNATILNTILKRKQFQVERGTGFQTFGYPDNST